MRVIDADALSESIKRGPGTDLQKFFADVCVATAPTVDAAPIVHGRWEFLGPNRLNKECMCGTCSVCKVRSKYIVNTALCPNCGAQMCNADYGGRAETAGGEL